MNDPVTTNRDGASGRSALMRIRQVGPPAAMRLARQGAVLAIVVFLAGCAGLSPDAATGPITIQSQGSFSVGGREVTAAGRFDPTASVAPPGDGQTFWVDQMYVQYQIPMHPRKLPLVLVHGGGGTARAWETTPDGREGFQNIFLRRGFPVYMVDLPRGGRSGIPSFTGPVGKLDDKQQIVAGTSSRAGREFAWSRWRLGPQYPEVFPVQAFPMQGVDQFMQSVRAIVPEDPEVLAAGLEALLEKIGPAVLVTHSSAGLYGWLAGSRSPHVRGIVSYEPAFVFPQGEMPPPVPLFKGVQDAGAPVSQAQFSRLASMPIQVVYGDNIPTRPIPDLVADGRRAQVLTAPVFAAALNRRGGKASVLLLPDAGLRGNSHFMFSDLNNLQVADLLSDFLARNALDRR